MAPELKQFPDGHIEKWAKAAVDLTAIKAEKQEIKKAATALNKTPAEIREMLARGEQVKW